MKVLIVEDELLLADYIADVLLEAGHQIFGMAMSYEKSMDLLKEGQPDFAMVDIQLKTERTGVDVAKALQQLGVPFIYLTANNEMTTIQEAAGTQPEAYLTKPFNKVDLLAAIEMSRQKSLMNAPRVYWLKHKGSKHSLPLDDIHYAKADGMYVDVVTTEKTYTQRITLKELEQALDAPEFIKVHRSYLVNSRHIESHNRKSLVCAGIEIPVSKPELLP